jgi:hypothetical protein
MMNIKAAYRVPEVFSPISIWTRMGKKFELSF